ncbi:MAG: polyribonucleotide nucleotidyltransferase [Proteobacteria bacterium]|nr:polyribonucleotide nucleotidyltransferase [Pseudomonadota bacterium]
MAFIKESAMLGNHEVSIETGRMAKQASGAVLIQCEETMVLVTCCTKACDHSDQDFFPLTCEYIEKMYAAGKIPGSYFRREGRQGEHETLVSRLIDRPVRPLFPDGFRDEVQVIATVVSYDPNCDPDVIAITGASAALMLSNLPWDGPVAGVRIGRIDGKWIANPTNDEREKSDTDIVMVASENAIVMVEGETKGLTEAEFLNAMDFGSNAVKDVLVLQKKLAEVAGKPKKSFQAPNPDPEITNAVAAYSDETMKAMTIHAKLERYAALDALQAKILSELAERFDGREKEIVAAYESLKYHLMRGLITNQRVRIDGRKLNQVRPITCEVGVLPRVHGSALFTRGETQSLASVTIGTLTDDQRIEALDGTHSKRFMLHYNFPPFSVGEVKALRSPGRREIGHGMLAERALTPVMPTIDPDYPYTLRIVSEILESNGSSSMATVCGGTLAAMDAGLEIKAPVAGVAMGLIKEGDNIAILTDILGDEDHLGDMDFKVCGTEDKITAIQMDIKISGITRDIMAQALKQAHEGRKHILGCMLSAIGEARNSKSKYAPRIETIKVKQDKIREIIGAGGKNIKNICAVSGAQVNIDDDGTVTIASDNGMAINKAIEMINDIIREAKPGDVYLGTVKKIMDFGAFVEIFPGTDGMVHISELTEGHVDNVTDILKEGEQVLVKVLSIDPRGKIKLSRRAAIGEQPTNA